MKAKIHKALIAGLLLIVASAWPASASAWPVHSRYFSLERETVVLDREHRATEAEAAALGALMDQVHERYRAAGFPEPILDTDSSGRWKIELIYDRSGSWIGVYNKSQIFGDTIEINMFFYRQKIRRETPATLAHEYFHAIQLATEFGELAYNDYQEAEGDLAKRQFDWIIEGMAEAAGAYAADGIGGYSNNPAIHYNGYLQQLAGLRSYAGPLHMDPPETFPRYPGLGVLGSHKQSAYNTSSFWRFLATESVGLRAFRLLLEPRVQGPMDPLVLTDWVHENIKTLPLPSGSGRRFPGGLPQAYAEFIAEFADFPFLQSNGQYLGRTNEFDEGIWHTLVFGRRGDDPCTTVELSPAEATSKQTLSLYEFGSACFHVSLKGDSSPAPSAFRVNVVADRPADEPYVCQAVALATNGAVIRMDKLKPLAASAQHCKQEAQITYSPRANMVRQTVVITNVHAAGGSGTIRGTRDVQVRLEFVLSNASASGNMSPVSASPQKISPAKMSLLSRSAKPATPARVRNAQAAAPRGGPTGADISVNSTSARARGAQARHATPRQQADCGNSPERCPQIEIDLGQYDERFEAITSMGNRLGGGGLVALDGDPRQFGEIVGILGDPEKLGAMAMEMAGSEYTEIELRFRAPEGRIETGMRWDDAVITARVATMSDNDGIDMSSHGPNPRPGACGSEPPPSGIVTITDVGEGWISGTFSADLYESYRHRPGRDRCAPRPPGGRVSGVFTVPYEDISQPPVDPELAAYQAWAGLPPTTWAVTDYDALVQQAVAAQRDLLREWEAVRNGGGGVGKPSPVACARTCAPGVMGCPDLSREEVERLTPIYLESLPAVARGQMRAQIADLPHEALSRLLVIGLDLKGCMAR